MERANDGIVIVQDGIMKFSNTRLAEILGYAIDEMIDTPFINYVYPADRKKLIDIYKRRIKGENVPGIYEMGGLNKDGSKIDIETNSGIITYKGKPAVLSLIRDITERKQVEEALKNAKEFTDTALNTQLDTFFLFEPSTSKAVRWNHAFTEITGYTDEEVSRMPAPVSYFSSEDMERAGAFIHKVLEDGTGTIDLELICKDGRKIPTEYKVSVIKDEQ